MRKILKFTGLGVLAVIAAIVVANFLLDPYALATDSMVPTYPVGTRIMVSEYHYDLFAVQRDDIVLFMSNDFSPEPWAHRIIAVAGDTVEINDGRVLVNGSPATFPETADPDYPGFIVPAGQVFQKGDSPYSVMSLENESSIIGKVVGTY